ncbi:MAG: tetraacyldisaccharide 4'-kinase [Janthinobacterium lividum]
MQAPAFWYSRRPSLAGMVLGPLGAITKRATARRLLRPGWTAPVPVICCGNVGVGGAGKTTLALDLAARLQVLGLAVHCLTRGYGGRVGRSVLRVDPDRHDATLVGDEALLLARQAPCWISADRAAGAQAAIAAGAQILLMDDGLQNPGLVQDWPLLVIDGAAGFGNGRLLPAGPLREPVGTAAARAAAAIMIGPDETGDGASLPPGLTVLHAELVMDEATLELRGRKVLAFAGIGRPEKFFDALDRVGLDLACTHAFPDHHRFHGRELDALQRDAARLGAILVTTPKDAVRLPLALRGDIIVAGVSLRWHDPAARDRLIGRLTHTKHAGSGDIDVG